MEQFSCQHVHFISFVISKLTICPDIEYWILSELKFDGIQKWITLDFYFKTTNPRLRTICMRVCVYVCVCRPCFGRQRNEMICLYTTYKKLSFFIFVRSLCKFNAFLPPLPDSSKGSESKYSDVVLNMFCQKFFRSQLYECRTP